MALGLDEALTRGFRRASAVVPATVPSVIHGSKPSEAVVLASRALDPSTTGKRGSSILLEADQSDTVDAIRVGKALAPSLE
jgi:hypothetical protein